MGFRLAPMSRMGGVLLVLLCMVAIHAEASRSTPVVGPAITRLEAPAAVVAGGSVAVSATIESAQGVDEVAVTFGGERIVRPGRGWRTVKLSETFPTSAAGTQQLAVRASDVAGRIREVTERIEVKPPTALPTLARRTDLDRLAQAERSRRSQIREAIAPGAASSQPVPGVDLALDSCTIRCKPSAELESYPADGCAKGYTSTLHFRIGATLRNRGTEGAAFEENWAVYGNRERPGGWQRGHPRILAPAGGLYVAPGAMFSGNDAFAPVAVEGGLAAGEHRFVFMVDPDNRIKEANEDNNTVVCMLTVTD